MVGYGRIFSVAGTAANYRSLLSCRSSLSGIQQCAGLKANALEKLGIPPKPKRPLSPFFHFLKTERVKVAADHPELSVTEIVRKVGQNWATFDLTKKEQMQKAYIMELMAYSKQMMTYEQSISPEHRKIIKEASIKKHDKDEKMKLKKKIEQLGKPKKPPTAFLQYMQERKYSKEKDTKVSEWIRNIAEVWRSMPDNEKAKYQQESKKLMGQYINDLKEWEERMVRLGHIDVIRNRGLIDMKSSNSKTE